jgi:COMPASS component SWD3
MAAPPPKKIKLEHPEPEPEVSDSVSAPPEGNTTATDNAAPAAPPTTQVPQPIDLLSEDQQYKISYILSGHKRAISSVKFSPDGKYLATAGTHSFSRE